MYGKIVSSNGIINIKDEYEVKFKENIRYLNITTNYDCILYLNGDKNGIYIHSRSDFFEIKNIPISSFKIIKPEIVADRLSWYGLY